MSFDARDLSQLIVGVYEAALDPGLWTGMAARIAKAADSSSTVLKTYRTGDEIDLVEMTENLVVAPKHQAWADYWHRHDLWVEHTLPLDPGQVMTGDDAMSAGELEQTGYYYDWLRRLDIFHVVGAALPLDPGAVAILGIHRDRRSTGYGEADRRFVSLLAPHLQQALKVRERLSPVAARASYAAMERLDAAVLVVDAARRILHANGAAAALLRDGEGLRALSGRLSAPAAEAPLARAVSAAVAAAAGRPRGAPTAFPVPRPGRWPLSVVAAPLPAGAAQDGRPAAILFVRDPERLCVPASLLRQLFSLTRAEAAVALALCRGASPDRIAADLGVGLSTVRSHLKRAMLKTQTRRQAELVALVLGSVGSA